MATSYLGPQAATGNALDSQDQPAPVTHSSPAMEQMKYADVHTAAALVAAHPAERNELMMVAQQTHGNAFVQQVIAQTEHVASPADGSFAAFKYRKWPVNGRVVNNWSKAVEVWSDEKGDYTIPPGQSSGYFLEDVDHVKDANGQWWKIGARTVTVDADGMVHGAECATGKSMGCPAP
jgi:hypothetical protein